MTIIRDSVNNFIGGISQQPDKAMYPNQAKVLDNFKIDAINGLYKRPPLEHIAKVCNKGTKYPYVHHVFKEDERYMLLLDGEELKVFDLQGNEKTLTYENDDVKSYITTEHPLLDLKCFTAADTTFILNKTKVTALSTELSPNDYPNSALIFINTAQYQTTYSVNVNGTTFSVSTSTEASTLNTNTLASQLCSNMSNTLTAQGFVCTCTKACILVYRTDGGSFGITAWDSNNNRCIKAFYGSAPSLQDLPALCFNGVTVKIVGENINIDDDYYVRFNTTNNLTTGEGTWKEVCCPNIQYKLDNTTMPVSLVRNIDGTFTLKTNDWGERRAGDTNSILDPSFIGYPIKDIFTHKGRLAFLSEDKIVMSDTEDIFSFFKQSVITELATDPIDIHSNSDMSNLYHHLVFNEELMLFSDRTEFTLSGGDIWQNSTVSMTPSLSYSCSNLCSPIRVGKAGFFVSDDESYSKILELFITSSFTTDAREITEQVPFYLPSGIFKVAGSTLNNTVLFLSHKTQNKVFVYSFYYASAQKAVSAWSEWTFKGAILNVDFYQQYCYVTTQEADGIYLNRVDFSNKNKEINQEFSYLLDRKVYINNTTKNEITTTINKPYYCSIDETELLILDSKGFPITILDETDDSITIQGLHDSVVLGYTYMARWVMPKIYVRQTTQTGSQKVREGILNVKDISLSYSDTGYFKVLIKPQFTTQVIGEYTFTGIKEGMAILSRLQITNGNFLLPVISNNEEIDIEVQSNSYLPCTFLSLDWIGDFVQRGT